MISLPLAERYLRQKRNVGPETDLPDACMADLVAMFPLLGDVATARQFWAVYRHGFLHQATMSTSTRRGATLPVGWLTHDTQNAVELKRDGSFCVHPVLFSQEIVRTIEADFNVFAGIAGGAPPLPSVARLDPLTMPIAYIGTHSGPRRS
jgi:hypothetical protein